MVSVDTESKFGLKDLTLIAFVGGLLVLVAFCTGVSSPDQFLGALGASLALALGTCLVGTLLGFLFGIPRTHQQDFVGAQNGQAQPGRDISYQINTNLEQISDWLTKIIIGVGLVQLQNIGDWLWKFSVTVGDGYVSGSAIAHAYVLGLLLYFFVCGFLFGYLWTRLFFGIAVKQADQGLVGKIEKWEADLRADAVAISMVTRQLNLAPGEPPVGEKELQDAVFKATSATRGRLYYDALAVRRNDERRELSIPVFKALIGSDTAKIYHDNYAQLAYALKDKAVPEWAEAERLLTEAITIRDRREEEGGRDYEFNRAVCRIQLGATVEAIAADFRKAAEDEWIRTWSLGRSADWMRANNLEPEDLGFLSA